MQDSRLPSLVGTWLDTSKDPSSESYQERLGSRDLARLGLLSGPTISGHHRNRENVSLSASVHAHYIMLQRLCISFRVVALIMIIEVLTVGRGPTSVFINSCVTRTASITSGFPL